MGEEFGAQAGEELLQLRSAAGQQSVGVVGLGDARASSGAGWDVLLQDGDAAEVSGQDAGGEQARVAAADDYGVVPEGCSSHRVLRRQGLASR